MGNENFAIQIKDVNKVYHLKHPDGKNGRSHLKDFYALKDLSLDIFKGDFVSIVGSNGSGKSTLLKMLSGILKPTTGNIKIYGTVSSVLELGVNLHPELSGWENALLQLKINGVRKPEIGGLMEQIRILSNIGDYFYEPVKFYSNGMFLRLGFALSFHANTDILLLDEVLSVGDEEFKLKCLSHLKKLTARNKTILLVTHNPVEAVSLCNLGIWLREGKIEKCGPAPEVLEGYLEWQREKYVASQKDLEEQKIKEDKKTDGFFYEWLNGDKPGNEILSINSILLSHENRVDKLFTDEEFSIEIVFTKYSREDSLSLLLVVSDDFGQPVFLSHNLNNTDGENYQGIFKHETGIFRMKATVPANFLAAGRYKLALQFGKNPSLEVLHTEEAFRYTEDIYFHLRYRHENADFIRTTMNGSVRPALKWEYVKAD